MCNVKDININQFEFVTISVKAAPVIFLMTGDIFVLFARQPGHDWYFWSTARPRLTGPGIPNISPKVRHLAQAPAR